MGLSLFHTRAHLYRAVLEGVAFALRHNMEAGGNEETPLDTELIVVGGAAKSDLWVQIIADVAGRPVLTIAENVEAAIGAALLAGIGAGIVTDEQAAAGWVTLTPHAQPRPHARQVYDELFATYRALYPALKDSMHALRRIARSAAEPAASDVAAKKAQERA